MRFEWDPDKNLANLAKHHIGFELAAEVFNDPLIRYIQDRDCVTEERWLALGTIPGGRLLVVVHTSTLADGEECIRIISARKATSHERKLYEE